MAKAIGPNFFNELVAAKLVGLPFSWGSDGVILFGPTLTQTQIQAIQAVYAAHDPTKPDPNAAAMALLATGLALASTGTPAINGTYALDQQSQSDITAEQLYIATTGKFTNGGATRAWPDTNGAYHTFPDTAHFTAFAEVCGQYKDAVMAAKPTALGGGNWIAPPNAYTVA